MPAYQCHSGRGSGAYPLAQTCCSGVSLKGVVMQNGTQKDRRTGYLKGKG
jgi:hypothetical protein